MTDDQQIRGLIERRMISAHDGDMEIVLANHDPGIVMFDVRVSNGASRLVRVSENSAVPLTKARMVAADQSIEPNF